MSNSPVIPNSQPISVDSLLKHELFVRSIVRCLLSDEDKVQDVLQETWLRALRSPPQQLRSLRAWLARVAGNLARDQHRKDGRRAERERTVARPESTLDASEAQLQAHRAVVEAVLGLEEPYKAVVLLSYYQGLSPARIAERLGRNSNTVRSQLHRAHEILRARMDAEYGEDRSAWAGLLLPFAAFGSASRVAGTSVGGIWGVTTIKALLALAACAAVVFVLPPLFMDPIGKEHEAGLSGAALGDGQAAGPFVNEPLPVLEEASVAARRAPKNGLRIVVELEGTPTPNVDVWLISSEMVDESQLSEHPEWREDPMQMLRQFAIHAKTNEEGQVLLKRPSNEFGVFATWPGFEGGASSAECVEGSLVVVLEKAFHLHVRVVDFANRPVEGVQVDLRHVLEERKERTRFRSGVTGADGRLVFAALDGLREAELEREFTFSAALGVPGVDVEIPFKVATLGDEEIILQLPPTARVAVRTIDSAGELLPLNAKVTLQSNDWYWGISNRAELKAGKASFEYVGIGKAFHVTVSIPDRGLEWKQEFEGPVQPGQEFHADIVEVHTPRIRGLAQQVDGTPLVRAQLHALVRNEEGNQLQLTQIRTDSLGVFHLELDAKIGLDARVSLRLLRYSQRGLSSFADSLDSIVVAQEMIDVGTLTLDSSDLVFSGRLLDDQGQPLRDFLFSASTDEPTGSIGLRTDSEGSFLSINAWPKDISLSIGPSDERSAWVFPESASYPRGSEDVTIRMLRGGSISGSVLHDDSVDLKQLGVLIYDTTLNRRGEPNFEWGEVDYEAGTYVLRGLRKDIYRVDIRYQNVTIQSYLQLKLATGEAIQLQPVDLRESLRSLQVRVFDEDGARLLAWVQAFANGKQSGAQRQLDLPA